MSQRQVLTPLGLVTLVRKLDFQAVIKSAASAASPTAWELLGIERQDHGFG